MTNVINACEVIEGCSYRLFPSSKRSRHIVVKCMGVLNGHPIFLYKDSEIKSEKIISDVNIHENVQVVSVEEHNSRRLNG